MNRCKRDPAHIHFFCKFPLPWIRMTSDGRFKLVEINNVFENERFIAVAVDWFVIRFRAMRLQR